MPDADDVHEGDQDWTNEMSRRGFLAARATSAVGFNLGIGSVGAVSLDTNDDIEALIDEYDSRREGQQNSRG